VDGASALLAISIDDSSVWPNGTPSAARRHCEMYEPFALGAVMATLTSPSWPARSAGTLTAVASHRRSPDWMATHTPSGQFRAPLLRTRHVCVNGVPATSVERSGTVT